MVSAPGRLAWAKTRTQTGLGTLRKGDSRRKCPALAQIGGQPNAQQSAAAGFCSMRSMRRGASRTQAVSRRGVLRGAGALGLTLPFGGCAAFSSAITRPDAPHITADPTLLVATTRKPANGARAKPWFGT